MSNPLAVNRFFKDLKDLMEYPFAFCVCVTQYDEERSSFVHVSIEGPADTPYVGGQFEMKISLPKLWPLKPPKVNFINKVWHPNICESSGKVCVDILAEKWAAGIRLIDVVEAVHALFSLPNPASALNPSAGMMFDDTELYLNTARAWTHYHAGGPPSFPEDMRHKIDQLVERGLEQDYALLKLSQNLWRLDRCARGMTERP